MTTVVIPCRHLADGACLIASGMAGRPAMVAADACAACTANASPQNRNSVTVSVAFAAVRSTPAEYQKMRDAYGYLVTREKSSADPQRLERIKSGTGVGSELWRLLESLGIQHTPTCGCLALAEEMNALGPAGCRRERERLVAKMRENAAGYGWDTVATAAGHAVLSGLVWRINPLDVYGSLLDEAIRRCEEMGPDSKQSYPRPQRLILKCNLCPGDVLTLTAAVESLHRTYPGEYLTDVRTPAREIWNGNPHVTPIADSEPGVRAIEMHYPSVHRSGSEACLFLAGYTEYLGEQLGRPLRVRTNRPQLFLTPGEQALSRKCLWPGAPDLSRPYWLINAGIKPDFTAKAWPLEYYQEIVDRTQGRVTWVQIGLKKHMHRALRGVINLVDAGGPPMRETILLAKHAAGGLGPVTFLQHLLAAWDKPYLCLVGGRESPTWVQYPRQHTFHTVGSLDCCADKGCWKARVVPLGDGDSKDKNLCKHPVTELERPAPLCLVKITPAEILTVLDRIL